MNEQAIMRIALVTDGIYPYVMGGMQKHSFYLCKYLAKQGVDIDLYHTNQSEFDIRKLENFNDEERSRITSIVIPFPASDRLPGHYIRSSYRYSLAVAAAYSQRPPVDFIYAKGFAGWKLAMDKESGRLKTAFAVNFHGYEMFQPPPNRKAWLEQKLLLCGPVRYICQHADFVMSYGSKITDIIRTIPVEDKKIVAFPTGIESDWLTEQAKPNSGVIRFLFVGRFERRKGIQELHAAIEKINDPRAEFHFIGPMPDKNKLSRSNVHYHGPVSKQEDIRAIYRTCDLLICPSYSEGMPNVILEAMASGLAILATDVGAVDLMVGADNGKLISLTNLSRLEDSILWFLGLSAADLMHLKRSSIDKVKKKFLWEEIAKQHLAFFEKHKQINGF